MQLQLFHPETHALHAQLNKIENHIQVRCVPERHRKLAIVKIKECLRITRTKNLHRRKR